LKDPDFPGIQYIVDFLSNVEDKELVWKYSKWILNEDQKLGVKVVSYINIMKKKNYLF